MEEKRKDPQARILPSMPMPSEDDSHPQGVPPPAPQAAPSPYDQKVPLGLKEASGYDEQLTTPATQPPTEPGDLSTGRILPSMPSQEIHSHSDDSPPSQPPAPQAGPSPFNYDHTPLNFEQSSVVFELQPRTGYPPMEPLEPEELDEGRILPSMPSQLRNSSDSSAEQPPTPHALMPPGFEQAPAYTGLPGPYPPSERGAMSAGGILPSMPTEGNDSPKLPSEPPAPQAAPSPYAQLQSGFAQQTQGYMQQPLAAYPQTERGGGRSYSYSASATGTESYSPMGGPSTVGIPPVQSYPGYESYQSTYVYPYGANGSTPYSSHVAMGSQAGYAASQMQMLASGGGSYAGVGAGGPMYGGAAQAYPPYGSGYLPPQQQQYPAPAPYDYHGLAGRGQARYQENRSFATRPGRPYVRDKSRSGPYGANLFVFHIPNEMTNEDMLKLFQPHGNVLSVRIMTERDTGRGKGFGFVSYDSAEAAANAIHFLNGFQIQGKRLKVQHKEIKHKMKDDDSYNQGRRSSPNFAPMQDHSRPSQHPQHHQGQSPAASGFVPAHESVPVQEYSRPSRHHQHHQGQPPAASGFVPVHEPVPVQEYAVPSEPDHRHEPPVLPPIDDDSHHCRTPTLPPIDEPRHRRQPTPTLPPIDPLDEGITPADYEGAQSYTTPQSPLADLKDIGKSLPDPK